MATGFNHHMNNYGGPPSNVTDLVANSALTATASEFVPNSAKKNKNFRKPKSSKIYVSSSRNHREKESTDVPNGFAEPSSVEDNGSSHRRHQNLEAFSASSTSARNLSYDSGIPAKSFGNPTGGQSSKSSPQYLGKNFNGPRSYNRGRQDWTGQSSGSYSNSNSNVQVVQDEGAVGIDHVQTFCNRNTASGYIKSKSRYGNNHSKNQQLEQPFYNDRPKFRDYRDRESSTSQRKDSNRVYDKDFGYGREKPRIWERGNNQLERNVSSYADDSFRDSGSSERSKNQYSERGRDTDLGRERPRVWERNNQLERNVSSYADDSFRDSGLSERSKSQYSGRGQDQDRYSSYRPNRRYADRYPGGKHEETNRDRNFGNHDFDERNYDRSYGSWGLRLKPDFSKEDFSGQRNTTYQQGRNTTQNFNTLETFDSNPGKFQAKESSKQHKEWYYSNTRERNESSSRVQTALKTMDMKDCDDISQRERLTEQLNRGTLECLVCCDRVRQSDSVWSCSNCFHVLHLRCVIKWAKSSKAETGWRCPACQNITENVPSQYRCFCGKILEPQWNRQDTPHTCGEVCGKSRESRRTDCTHRCNLLCHPGPCPSCVAQVTRNCGCGKTSQMVKCALEKPVLCDAICGKILNCGVHFCEIKCHPGPCSSCQQEIDQVCFCKKQRRKVTCIPENQGVFEFSCNEPCYQELTCGNHKCEEICHEGKCKSCQLAPDIITHCPCGQTELSQHVDEKRKTCLDPIPTCEKLCGRKLSCGQPSNPHMCKLKCHPGTCPPCPFTTMVRCRCGHMDKEIPCNQLTSKADDARCEKKCTRKRSCAKHKCNQLCCIEIDHPCPLPCNHTLSCGLHRCDQLCHRGHCQPCWRTSFEELFCECGAEVMYPPVACGTKPPSCSRPCTRVHDCEHPALHTCHNDPNCPPCTVLTQKYCYGNHELRKSIPCHQIEFSCGLPCNKELPCGHHKCILVCHKGDCLREGAVCTQPCNVLRPPCQHPCSAPCHEGSCPESPCKETVRVTCECGHRSATRPCAENTKEYQRIATSLLASKMADVQLGHSIDISDIMGNATTKRLYLKSLDCNEECKVIERNRRMAIGLQIRNPDLSQKLTPRYSDFMRGWAKKDPVFCQNIHDRLTDLVKLAKESKQKSRSHSFEVMNRERRQFVHEYCEHFGCESVAYDQEPKRNVVATAQKAKAWLPSVGLLELVQREAGQRKVPGPILNSVKRLPSSNMDTLASKWASKTSSVNDSFSSISGQASNSSVLPIGGLNPSCYDDNSANGSSTTHFIDHFNS